MDLVLRDGGFPPWNIHGWLITRGRLCENSQSLPGSEHSWALVLMQCYCEAEYQRDQAANTHTRGLSHQH